MDYSLFVFCSFFFFLPTFVFAQTPVSDCPTLSLTFGIGAQNAQTNGEVSSLQQFLLNYEDSSSTQPVTGYFGSLTEKSLIHFQTQQQIATSGILDATTRAAIASICNTLATTTPEEAVPVPSVTLDNNPLTSLLAEPVLSGSVTNLTAPLSISITTTNAGDSNKTVYENNAIPVIQNRWAVIVSPALPEGVYTTTFSSGGISLASSTLTIGLRSFPTIDLSTSLPQFDVADGRLMRFEIRANPGGPIGIDQLSFAFLADSADVTSIELYGYTDPEYSQPIATTTSGLINTSPVDPVSDTFAIIPPAPLEIPAGETYYFELDGSVTPSDTLYSVETTLLGDPPPATIGTVAQLVSTSSVIWSPNTYGISATTTADWINGSLVTDLPQAGILEVRSSAPASLTPTCTMSASTSTISSTNTQPITITWTSNGANYAVWSNGTTDALQGSRVFSGVSSTQTFILAFHNQYGETTCFSTITVPTTVTTVIATTTTDGFSASPLSGPAPLAVTFTGSINNSKSCSALTDTFSFGDASTTQLVVAKNLCKVQSFTLSHTYSKTGTYTAGLYTGAFSGFATGTAQLIQKQSITVQSKVGFSIDPSSNLANVLSAFRSDIFDWTIWVSQLFKR